MQTIGMIVLAIACLFMAGLNLWNEFKDWFDKKYERKNSPCYKAPAYDHNKPVLDERVIPDIVGKSKTDFKLMREQQKEREERQKAEQARKLAEEAEEAEEEQNKPIYGMDLEKETNPPASDGKINADEEFIPLAPVRTKEDAALSGGQAVTVDEIGLMIKSLSGKPIAAEERTRVPETMSRFQGTDMYGKLLNLIEGAKEVAFAALNEYEEENESSGNASDNKPSDKNRDFNKYIRL